MTTTCLLLLVRHGETEFNTHGIYQGQMDSPLTPGGIAQARALTPRIRQLQTSTALYCSDLGRARRTAELLALPAHHTIHEDAGLRERHYGIFQGKEKERVAAQFPDVWQRYRSGDPDFILPEGESQRQFGERVWKTMNRLADAHPGERVVVVSHGGTLGVFAKQVLGLPLDAPRPFDLGNTSLSIIGRAGDHWKIRTLGELAHLSQLPPANQTEG